jgi:hypothetical protein
MGRLENAGAVVREWLSLPLVAVCLTGWRMCGYSSSFVDGAAGLMRHEARTVLVAVVCVLPWPLVLRALVPYVLVGLPASEGVLRAAGLIVGDRAHRLPVFGRMQARAGTSGDLDSAVGGSRPGGLPVHRWWQSARGDVGQGGRAAGRRAVQRRGGERPGGYAGLAAAA